MCSPFRRNGPRPRILDRVARAGHSGKLIPPVLGPCEVPFHRVEYTVSPEPLCPTNVASGFRFSVFGFQSSKTSSATENRKLKTETPYSLPIPPIMEQSADVFPGFIPIAPLLPRPLRGGEPCRLGIHGRGL